MINNHSKSRSILLITSLLLCTLVQAQDNMIKNPVAPRGHDSWVIQKGGFYYCCYYSYKGGVWINRHKTLQGACRFNGKRVWTPPRDKRYSKGIWAPELHFLQGSWYIYFAADYGDSSNHRMYVLENKSGNPSGQ